jgi:hypothetical protein
MVCASQPGLYTFSWPCAGLGLLLALVDGLRALAQGYGQLMALAGTVVNGAVLLVAGFWPGLFNPWTGQAGAGKPPDQPLVLHVGKGTGRASTSVAEDAWVDASQEAVQRGDIRVRVLSAWVAIAPFKDPARIRSARDRYLLIVLRLYNTGAERRIPYDSWGEPAAGREADLARLNDNLGKTYRLRNFDPNVELVGRLAHARVSPGQYVDDLLVFEPPSASVEYLRLELPGAACGSTGTFRLQLPRSLVRYR